ncbi:SdiA-regulated [Dyadobacter koreensis]|uniref:SdiA-regulated n=1 Tax=Dyadobacter koreensis TaxID=408657 RepID=A0A1H6YNH0_9BACT|nr:SdiA-regulated domain-containing protein [Dyadobacter koreensis]SEJ42831.1 SdiA-regulated [Dyadobacter koreensis]
MNYTVSKIIGSALMLITLGTGCTNSHENEQTLKDYNLESPEKFFMPESLFEISGIAFNKGNNDTIYAIQDEEGRLFRLGLGVKKQVNSKFGKKGDYEDLAIANDRVVILKSNGTMYSFPMREAIFPEADSVQEWKKILPKGEYESMYADEATDNIYVLCKNCPEDDSKKSVTGYEFHLGDSSAVHTSFQINVKDIKALSGKVERGFRPSGLAQNPLTKDWYIISAVNKLLVVTDSNWKVQQAVPLNGNKFTQPEGIAFDAAGNLYISNEGDDFAEGNILKFKKLGI